jgi:Flp pilus assembly protein TadG
LQPSGDNDDAGIDFKALGRLSLTRLADAALIPIVQFVSTADTAEGRLTGFGTMPRSAFCFTRRLAGDRKGAAAVEFALIAPLFFALAFSILEAGWFFFVNSAVDQANARAARLIRTGQAQNPDSPMDRTAFFDEICNVVKLFGDCNARLTVDVASFASFDALSKDLSAPVCRDADQADVDALPYSAGAQRQIVRVRVCWLHKTINPGIGLDLAQAPDGSRKLMSVSIFRNEPFSS